MSLYATFRYACGFFLVNSILPYCIWFQGNEHLNTTLQSIKHYLVLTDLAKSSGYLVKKFINPNPEPDCGEINGMKQNSEPLSSQPDLIDLFNRVSENMQRQIEIIGKNMEVVSTMID